jgi:tripartite-type tricarboxylate transporter receptor subunit TctC
MRANHLVSEALLRRASDDMLSRSTRPRKPEQDMSRLSRRNLLHAAIGVSAAPLMTDAAAAQDTYPSRPIHLVVGFPPGSAADITARAFGNGAEGALGQKIIVEDKPGAGSSLAAQYVARAAADGYTLFLVTVSNATDQATKPNLPFNLVSDFAPISLLASGAVVLVVGPQSNLHSVADLIALARSKPDGVLCATAGVGSIVDLVAVLFAQRAGIKIVRVPYPGSPQAVSDLMAGRVTMFFSPASTVVGQIAAGKLIALATAATKRASVLPNVPSMAEAGMPDFDASLWLGLVAPAGTPQGAIEKIAKAAEAAMHAPQAVATLKRLGFDPIGAGPDRFGPYLRSEIVRWSDVARSAGMKR